LLDRVETLGAYSGSDSCKSRSEPARARPGLKSRAFGVWAAKCRAGLYGLSPVRPGFVGPAGLCRATRASSVRPGFVGPAGLCRSGRASSGPARHFAARTPKARLLRPGRARAGSDRLLHESVRVIEAIASYQFSRRFVNPFIR